jgi:hypothetical protein
MNPRNARAATLASRLNAAPATSLHAERDRLAGLPDAELRTLYREQVQEAGRTGEDLDALTPGELLGRYRALASCTPT